MKSNAFILLLLGASVLFFAHPEISPLASLLTSSCAFAFIWLGGDQAKTNRGKACIFFSCYAFVFSGHFFWLARPEYHGFPILILYGILVALYAFFFTWISLQVLHRKESVHRLLLLGGWLYLFEWAMGHFLCGFTLDELGVHLLWHPISAQGASFFGSRVLSLLVFYTNVMVFFSTKNPSARKGAMLLLLSPYLVGVPHYFMKERAAINVQRLSVGLIQTGLLPEEKRPIPKDYSKCIPLYLQWKQLLMYAHELREKTVRLDLVVFPEAAVPFAATAPVLPLQEAQELLQSTIGYTESPSQQKWVRSTYLGKYVSHGFFFEAISSYLQAPVYAGLLHEEGYDAYTSIFAFYPDGKMYERYDKRILVPVAEGVPFSILRTLSAQYGISDFFTPGKEYQALTGPVKIMPNICYEEMRGDVLRHASRDVQLFLNVTNDVWYPHSTLPERHYAQAKLRAIENGVACVRSCNTGITAAVMPTGREIGRLVDKGNQSEWAKGAICLDVPAISFSTPFSLWGETPIASLMLLLIVLDVLHLFGAYHRIKKRIDRNGKKTVQVH